MRLELFTVKNFRSINKAEKLPLGEFTVLLGPNNEGKSNILQAMVLGMEELTRSRGPLSRVRGPRRLGMRTGGAYDWERDFPQALQASTPDGRTVMHFDFQLTDEEVEEFYREVGSRLNGALPLALSFGRQGAPVFAVRKPRHAKALAAKRGPIADFVAARVQVQYVEAIRTGRNVANIVGTMLDRELAAAVEDNEDYFKAVAKVREIQQPVFDAVANSIGENLRDLLPDVSGVRIVVDDDGAPTRFRSDVQVIVDDGTPTDLRLKGDGVQSLAALAMTQHYSRATARAREFILAVEEPEAHLHPRAIHGLKETLRETASTQQVIITTHSPLFANRLELSSNIIVRKNRAQPARSAAELRDALGVRTADNLASAEVVLVVEGMADEVALRAVLPALSPPLKRALTDGVLTVMPLRGGGNLTYLLSILRDSLASLHAFLDNDDEGRRAAKRATDEGLLDTGEFTLTICLGAKDSEFEDLLDPSIYRDAFSDRFGVDVDAGGFLRKLKKGKWSHRMDLAFQANGQPWNEEIEVQAKTIVAEAVAANPAAALSASSSGVLDSLVKILVGRLEARQQ